MPAAGIIQQSLTGGGIAGCPDGSIYYSYINSPRILRLEGGASGGIRAFGEGGNGSFQVVSDRSIRDAQHESLRTHSVAPLVKLGLGGSRVMGLFCSDGGLLFRQVAEPAGGGSHVEVWNARSEDRVGTVPVGGAVLLAVADQTLYLGQVSEERSFTLERIRYRVEPSRGVS